MYSGWDDIGYNFLVGEDGRVYEGRGWTTLPAHSPVYNDFSHGTCIMGNYMTVAPAQVALDATQAWIQCGVDLVSINYREIRSYTYLHKFKYSHLTHCGKQQLNLRINDVAYNVAWIW